MSQVITSPIPGDLASLPGVETGFNPPSINGGRWVITGRPGVGKSTLLHSNKRAFVLDPEHGGRTVADPVAVRFAPDPAKVPEGQFSKVYTEVVDKLISRFKAGKKDYELLGMDTLDEMIELFLRDFCLEQGINDPLEYRDGEGNGYSIVRHRLFDLLDRAHKAGMGWAVVAHTTTKQVKMKDGKERTLMSLAISDSFNKAIFRKCEHMVFLDYLTKTVSAPPIKKKVAGKVIEIDGPITQELVRILKVKPGGLWKDETATDVKVRVPLPDMTELPSHGGWGVLTEAYDSAVKTLIEGATT